MARRFCILAFIQFLFLPFAVACPEGRLSIMLPEYDPPITVFGDHGVLSKRKKSVLKYKDMSICVRIDTKAPAGVYVPKSFCDAREELERTLPTEYFNSLMASRKDLREIYSIPEDPDVDERLDDAVEFFANAWGGRDARGWKFLGKSYSDSLDMLLEILSVDSNYCSQ